ncbi:MAG TPA: hypothetical protein VGE52_02520, partial [Pirellulales bacterium]
MKRSLLAFFLAAGLAAPGAFSLSAFAQESQPDALGCPFLQQAEAKKSAVVEYDAQGVPLPVIPSVPELAALRAAWADDATTPPEAAPAPAAAIDDAPAIELPAADESVIEFDFGASAEPPAPTEEPAEEVAPALDAPAMEAEAAVAAPVEAEPALDAPLASEPSADLVESVEALEEIVGDAPPAPTDEAVMEDEAAAEAESAVEAEAADAPVANGAVLDLLDLPCRLPEQAAIEAAEAIDAVETVEVARPVVGRTLASRIGSFGRNALVGFGDFLAAFNPGNWFADDAEVKVELNIAIDSEGVNADVAIDEVPALDEAMLEAAPAADDVVLDLAVELEVANEAEVAAEVEAAMEPSSLVGVDEPTIVDGEVIAAPITETVTAEEPAPAADLDLSVEALIVGVTAEAVGSGVVANLDAPAIDVSLTDEASATIEAAESPAAAPAMSAEDVGPALAIEDAPVEAEVAVEAPTVEASVAIEAPVAIEAEVAAEIEVAAEVEPAMEAEVAAPIAAVAPVETAVNPFDAAADVEEMFAEDAPPAPES